MADWIWRYKDGLVHALARIPHPMWRKLLDETKGCRYELGGIVEKYIYDKHLERYGDKGLPDFLPRPPCPLEDRPEWLMQRGDDGDWDIEWNGKLSFQQEPLQIPVVIQETQIAIHKLVVLRMEAIAELAIDAHIDRYGSLSGWRKVQ